VRYLFGYSFFFLTCGGIYISSVVRPPGRALLFLDPEEAPILGPVRRLRATALRRSALSFLFAPSSLFAAGQKAAMALVAAPTPLHLSPRLPRSRRRAGRALASSKPPELCVLEESVSIS